MTAAYRAQIAAATGISPATSRKPPKGATVPAAPLAPSTGQRNTPKEQPGPKAGTPLRWQAAGPLHAEQFPGEFRLVVTGPLPMLPALVNALDELARLAKAQFIEPVS